MNRTLWQVVAPTVARKETNREVPRVETSALMVGLMGPAMGSKRASSASERYWCQWRVKMGSSGNHLKLDLI